MGVSWILSGFAAWPHSVASRYGRRPASFFFSFFFSLPAPHGAEGAGFFLDPLACDGQPSVQRLDGQE